MTLRREFLALTAGAAATGTALPGVALATVPAVGATVPPNHSDAELMGWCAALIDMEEKWRRQLANAEDSERPCGYHATVESITRTAAKTDEGNRAKLAAAVAFFGTDGPEKRALLGPALWDAVRALAWAPIVAAPPVDPDAVLLELCRVFDRQFAALQAFPPCETEELQATFDDMVADRWKTAWAINKLVPSTIAGLRAKAKVALAHLIENRGANTKGDGDATLAIAALRDLVGEVRP